MTIFTYIICHITLSKQPSIGTEIINIVPKVMTDSLASYWNKSVILSDKYSQRITLLGHHYRNHPRHTPLKGKNNTFNTYDVSM